MRTIALVAAAAVFTGCSSAPVPTPDVSPNDGTVVTDATVQDVAFVPDDGTTVLPDTGPVLGGDAGALVAARPYSHRAPANYDGSHALPLVVLLHGYSANGAAQDLYFGLSRQVDALGFLYAYPDGTLDAANNRFWNATDACCDFGHIPVDDVAYVSAIIDDMSARYRVDPARVFVIGHSNGAFMSHRLACDLSSRVAAIVSLAGANWLDMTRCAPTQHVSVLDVHGDADAVISYTGGTTSVGAVMGAAYPGEAATIGGWAARSGCSTTMDTTTPPLDLDSSIPGPETAVARFTGCPTGIGTELWTIHGGSHIPAFNPAVWAPAILNWLFAHGR